MRFDVCLGLVSNSKLIIFLEHHLFVLEQKEDGNKKKLPVCAFYLMILLLLAGLCHFFSTLCVMCLSRSDSR